MDARELLYPKRYGSLRVHKDRETVRDLPILHLDRPDLYDAVVHRGKSCRLNVKYHDLISQKLSPVPADKRVQVIHQIALHAVDHLEKIKFVRLCLPGLFALCLLRLPQIFPHMVCVREGLHDAVVGDRDSRHTPLIGAFYDVLHLGNPIHIAHLCMTVQLHPLSDAVVHPPDRKIGNFFHAGDRGKSQLMIKFIRQCHTFDLQEISLLQKFFYLSGLLGFYKDLYTDRIRHIRDREDQDRLPYLFYHFLLKIENFPADDHLADLIGDILDGDRIPLKVSAENDIRILGAPQRPECIPVLFSAGASQHTSAVFFL